LAHPEPARLRCSVTTLTRRNGSELFEAHFVAVAGTRERAWWREERRWPGGIATGESKVIVVPSGPTGGKSKPATSAMSAVAHSKGPDD
jgi:hypothetical protein